MVSYWWCAGAKAPMRAGNRLLFGDMGTLLPSIRCSGRRRVAPPTAGGWIPSVLDDWAQAGHGAAVRNPPRGGGRGGASDPFQDPRDLPLPNALGGACYEAGWEVGGGTGGAAGAGDLTEQFGRSGFGRAVGDGVDRLAGCRVEAGATGQGMANPDSAAHADTCTRAGASGRGGGKVAAESTMAAARVCPSQI
jgi:hypothetical protein